MAGSIAAHSRFQPSHRWRVLGIGVAANGSMGAVISGIPATSVFVRAGYHIDTTRLGSVLAAMGLGLALSELPWGLVTDRLGDRRVLLVGLGLTGAVLALMAAFVSPTADHVPPVALLGLGLLLVGVIGGSLNGSSGRAVMAWFRDEERGFAMSVRQMSLPAGGALGSFVLPRTAEHFGFRAAYGFLAAFCLITAAFTWAWLHDPPSATAPPSASSARTDTPKTDSPLRNGQIWRTVCGLGALCVPQVATVTFTAVFLNDAVHLGSATISNAIVTFQLASAVTRVWSGRFTDRHKNRRPFLKACAFSTALIFAALSLSLRLAKSSPAAASPLLIVDVGLLVLGATLASTWHGVAYTELATIAGMSHVATALGLGNTFAFGCYFVTPLLLPVILKASGWPNVWLAAALAALLAFKLFPSPKRDGLTNSNT